jgi:hypothetical protein
VFLASLPVSTNEPRKSGEDMTKIRDLHRNWINDPAYRKEYDALEEEFSIIAAIAKARRGRSPDALKIDAVIAGA